MARYQNESPYNNSFRRTVVEAIEKEGISIEEARVRYDIGSKSTIRSWIIKCGRKDLLPKKGKQQSQTPPKQIVDAKLLKKITAKNKKNKMERYQRISPHFKREIVEAVIIEGLSIEEACIRYGIRSENLIQKWINSDILLKKTNDKH